MKAVLEPAYVLHSHDWSESSLILDLFTRRHGRVVLVAKGAKRPTSQLRAVLLPFQRLNLSFGSRRSREDASASEVQVLRTAERAGGGPMPRGEGLLSGFYLNELLIKLLAREDPHPVLFDAYAEAVALLVSSGDDAEGPTLETALRAFELLLLRETGVLPELARVTATQQPVLPTGHYGLHAERGVVVREGDPAGLDGAWFIAIEEALSAGPQSRGLAGVLAAVVAAHRGTAVGSLKLPLRELLQYHLGSSPLRTRALMQDLSRIRQVGRPAR